MTWNSWFSRGSEPRWYSDPNEPASGLGAPQTTLSTRDAHAAPGTEGAWLQGYDEGRLVETPRSQLGCGITQGQHLCMRRRVTCGLPLVVTAGHDPSAGHHDCSYRYLAVLAGLPGLCQCQCHQVVV